jgi:hypothetical protein
MEKLPHLFTTQLEDGNNKQLCFSLFTVATITEKVPLDDDDDNNNH